jgi:hypothetical protein
MVENTVPLLQTAIAGGALERRAACWRVVLAIPNEATRSNNYEIKIPVLGSLRSE